MARTADQLKQSIEAIRIPQQEKHFTHCSKRFGGERSAETVKAFIDAISYYKATEGISDENALKGFALLLEGAAHTWWSGIKDSVDKWEDATRLLKNEFSPTPPAHVIYCQLFATRQDETTPTGEFIAKKRPLLADLEHEHEEKIQINMVYGLLKPSLKEKVSRLSITTFVNLIEKAREVEKLHEEVRERRTPKQSNNDVNHKKKVRCQYCRNFGHTADECRKRKKDEAPALPQQKEDGQPRCYGCQTPGYIRRTCPKCNSGASPDIRALSFCSVDLVRPRARPAVLITNSAYPEPLTWIPAPEPALQALSLPASSESISTRSNLNV